MRHEDIAKICHETNRAYYQTLGDDSQQPWDAAPQWQRDSALKGVLFIVENPMADPSASHVSWLKEKEATGWRYGPIKDADKKEHPCFVDYYALPAEQRLKDHLFGAVVRACIAAP